MAARELWRRGRAPWSDAWLAPCAGLHQPCLPRFRGVLACISHVRLGWLGCGGGGEGGGEASKHGGTHHAHLLLFLLSGNNGRSDRAGTPNIAASSSLGDQATLLERHVVYQHSCRKPCPPSQFVLDTACRNWCSSSELCIEWDVDCTRYLPLQVLLHLEVASWARLMSPSYTHDVCTT